MGQINTCTTNPNKHKWSRGRTHFTAEEHTIQQPPLKNISDSTQAQLVLILSETLG